MILSLLLSSSVKISLCTPSSLKTNHGSALAILGV
jgi:hypothetical protein